MSGCLILLANATAAPADRLRQRAEQAEKAGKIDEGLSLYADAMRRDPKREGVTSENPPSR